MNTTVIDDSIDEARQLAGFISTYCSDAHTCRQTTIFSTTADFLRHWQRGSFSLILIDTFLRNGTSGIRIAERVREGGDSCTIAFTTSSTDFTLKEYKVHALDYMVKPIRHDEFGQTMGYFLSVSRRKQSHYIEVKESRTMQKIPIDSTLYTNYSNHYIQIRLPDKTVRTYMRFEDFSGMLLIYSQFVYCYRNCIINVDKVFSIEKSEFILTTGEHLPITRTMRSQIHQQYADYQFSRLDGGIG